MPSALIGASWLEEIAAHLLVTDGPHADWFNEAIALTRTGTSLDAALGWSGYEIPLKQQTQTEALAAMVATLPPGEATAEAVHRRLTAQHPDALAAAYIRAGGRTSLRSVHRRLAALRAANGALALAGDFAA